MRLTSRDVHFCATCVWIRHVAPHRFICRRLGWETRPRWKFRCWTPRPEYMRQDEP
ncbi:hypothetical protein TPY_1728 [Sulfobacillus acidophilus TPY]|uniref:Uncharacterized protein n=1 Tax=Sulfobacillus acidophilus (strain ATCC 700253 / DSM 10332 / NAL) TaxID=679936 RepID=G8U1A0_SULAD|nr:hypothetical protein TPY_1728 [Sulfobacillus acidophilus TPY]AEW05420.1 hypothetical protein Sulac_1928 [Sulfobacillus acidophilus DSM 10332]